MLQHLGSNFFSPPRPPGDRQLTGRMGPGNIARLPKLTVESAGEASAAAGCRVSAPLEGG